MQARKATGQKGGEKKKNMAPKVEKACHEIPSGFFQASPPRIPYKCRGVCKTVRNSSFDDILITQHHYLQQGAEKRRQEAG